MNKNRIRIWNFEHNNNLKKPSKINYNNLCNCKVCLIRYAFIY